MVKSLSEEFSLDLGTDLLFDRDDLLVSFGMDLQDAGVQKRSADASPELMQEIKDRKKLVREKYKDTNPVGYREFLWLMGLSYNDN
jgi:hypothetical protein